MKARLLARHNPGDDPNAETAERPTGPRTDREIEGSVREAGPVAPAGLPDADGPGLGPDLRGLGVL